MSQDKLERMNKLSDKYGKNASRAARNFAYIVDIFVIFCFVPIILVRGFGGIQTVVFAAAIVLFAVLAVTDRVSHNRTGRDREEFYGLLTGALEEALSDGQPVMNEEPDQEFFAAPLDYGFLDSGKEAEGMSVSGMLRTEYPDAAGEGYVYVKAYCYDEEMGPADENGKRKKEACYRIAQGLVWRITLRQPVTPGCYVKISRQRKSLGNDFLGQFLPGGRKRIAEIEDPEFNSRFRVQSDDTAFAERYLTLERIRRLVILRDYAGEMNLYVKDREITAAFTDLRLMDAEDARPSGIGRVTAESLAALREQLRQITQALPVLWED